MGFLHWHVIRYVFKCLCIVATGFLVGMWIYRYSLDEDTSVIESRLYFDSEDDLFPVMSMCFNQVFNDSLLKQYGIDSTGMEYRNFVLGQYFQEDMGKINYNLVSTNLSEFILSYEVNFQNGSSQWDTKLPSHSWLRLNPSHSWESWGRLLKCFTLEIGYRGVNFVRLYFKRDVFQDRIRPNSGEFAVLFHYPNQMFTSKHTLTRQWTPIDNTSNYWMSFNIKRMEAILNRYKRHRNNCVQNWKNYDNYVLGERIKSVGCKTPDQHTNLFWPICNNTEKMKKARIHLKTSPNLRPCREIESLDYQIGDSVATFQSTEVLETFLKFPRKDWNNWFSIVIRFLNPRFKLTVQKKEVDFQSLIGYVGGYIGLFMGFTVAEIPEVIMTTFIYIKRSFSEANPRNKQIN